MFEMMFINFNEHISIFFTMPMQYITSHELAKLYQAQRDITLV